ncbi:Multicopper oxidase type 2 [Penicillium fimorum]|uniref:Multicopper oxidase type 2 n=1 Tax=Penicillium fimorum TaxID=1882269 RepID=A0A9W9XYK2_9EURO|nr:Multicopper oxidase type 2 [Penicillium fimorum]
MDYFRQWLNNLEPQVTIQTKNGTWVGTWVDLLLQLGEVPNSPATQAPHVMHRHSNKGFILGVGPGLFKWPSTEEAYAERPELFQLKNPR